MRDTLSTGFLIGFVAASPIGPIGMLCLRRTLSRGVVTGLVSALGVSCAYAFWSFVAVHGVAAASRWIETERLTLELVIGVFFVLHGLHGLFNTPGVDYPTLRSGGHFAVFLSTFLVVFLNPTTFIMFSAFFALLGFGGNDHGLEESLEVALLVLTGSIVFWVLTARIVAGFRDRIHESRFRYFARLSSSLIVVFGVGIVAHDLYEYLRPLS